MSGYWVVLEGTDDVGKTTLCDALCESLLEGGFEALRTAEPGSTRDQTCSDIRSLLFSDAVHDKAEIFLFLADRIQHEERVVLPALKDGHVVVQDRGALSTFVYQVILDRGGRRRVTAEQEKNYKIMKRAWKGRRLPDLIVLCDADDDVLEPRRKEDADHFVSSRGKATIEVYRDLGTGSLRFPAGLVGRTRVNLRLNTYAESDTAVEVIIDRILGNRSL